MADAVAGQHADRHAAHPAAHQGTARLSESGRDLDFPEIMTSSRPTLPTYPLSFASLPTLPAPFTPLTFNPFCGKI